MLKARALELLAGVKPREYQQASAPTNLHVISGEVGETSEEGKVLVRIDGLVFGPEDTQYVEVDTLGGLKEGDTATILLTGEPGHGMTPLAIGGVGSVDRIIVRIAAIEADYVKAEVLDANYAHISNGVIDNATINYADVDDLETHYAKIDAANITELTTQSAWVDKLMVQTGLIAHEGTVYTLDAVQVNAANITAGTIDVQRLIVTVDGEKYVISVVDGQTVYQKIDGDVLQDLTITTDKLVAGAVTAEKITTENIVGSGGWINLRNGTFTYANALTGQGISWDGSHLSISGSVTIGTDSVSLSGLATTVANTLIYDHSYVYDSTNEKYVFTAHLYQGGNDVAGTTHFPASQFTWYLKNENSTTETYLGSGLTCDVPISMLGYGSHVIGKYTTTEDSYLLTENDDALTTEDDDPLTGRTPTGESVRISDLSVSTTLYGTDKFLISGAEDEHLVTMDTIQAYLEAHMLISSYQGTLSAQSTLTNAEYRAGYYWLVTTDGTYATISCEEGDMVYAIADRGSSYSANDFVAVQANQQALTNLEIEALLALADA